MMYPGILPVCLLDRVREGTPDEKLHTSFVRCIDQVSALLDLALNIFSFAHNRRVVSVCAEVDIN